MPMITDYDDNALALTTNDSDSIGQINDNLTEIHDEDDTSFVATDSNSDLIEKITELNNYCTLSEEVKAYIKFYEDRSYNHIRDAPSTAQYIKGAALDFLLGLVVGTAAAPIIGVGSAIGAGGMAIKYAAEGNIGSATASFAASGASAIVAATPPLWIATGFLSGVSTVFISKGLSMLSHDNPSNSIIGVLWEAKFGPKFDDNTSNHSKINI